ncbi:hypothetical protein EJB05_57431, partial [Eragrostis curvula]
MAGRARGRGPRPASPEAEWGEWAAPGWNQFPGYGQPGYFHGMPPPPQMGYGFYPPMGPPPPHQHQPQPPFHQNPQHQQPFNQQHQRPRNQGMGFRPQRQQNTGREGVQDREKDRLQVSGSQKQEQKQESGIGMSKMEGKQVVEEKGEISNKSLAKYKVVCYNCSESRHYSTKCPKPKLCLREEIMQFMDVRSGRNHNSQPSSLVVQVRGWGSSMWMLRVDQTGGSEVTKEEIIRNLQKIFDKDWSWCIRELGEYSYSVRFPPDSKVESTVFGGTTYFYLDKEGVMVSLKAWSGEVQPVEELVDTWVTVRGVPPKWNDWETIQQIASSLGMFEVVIIKVAVRDPTKIPRTRLMEMAKKIYLLSFKVEGAEQVGGGNNPDNFDDDDLLGDDQGMEESDTNSKMDTDKSQTPSNTESKRKEDKGAGSSKNPAGSKTVSMWADLFREIEKEVTAAEEHTL